MGEHRIEVLFATHNGARTLPRMLQALAGLKAPKRPWRIIAVDNCSSDETPALLKQAQNTLPLTALSCAEPGKMPALKLGAGAVSGSLVVFTDDDVEPAPDWLAAYEAAAEAVDEGVGVFGGPIVPTPLEDVSDWFKVSSDHHAELFARSDEPEGPVDASAHLYGPNFMIRAAYLDVLEQVAPGLGPTFVQGQAKSFAMGEDTEIMDLIQRRGASAQYVRAASVRHLVRGFQTELEFMLSRAERHGRGAAIRMVEAKNRSWARRAKLALAYGARAMATTAAPETPSTDAFNAMWDARWARGAVQGALCGPYPQRAQN